MHKLLWDEINDIINDIAKMAPLIPDYIYFNSAEIATAVMLVTINYSWKLIWSKAKLEEKNKLNDMRGKFSLLI